MKRIFCYLEGTKDNGMVFNPSMKMVEGFYTDADFVRLWGHENSQDPICARIRTGFVVTFFLLSSIVGVKTTDTYFTLYSTL